MYFSKGYGCLHKHSAQIQLQIHKRSLKQFTRKRHNIFFDKITVENPSTGLCFSHLIPQNTRICLYLVDTRVLGYSSKTYIRVSVNKTGKYSCRNHSFEKKNTSTNFFILNEIYFKNWHRLIT